MTSTPIIDIHVHSTLKPYGNSFYSNSNKRSITDSACVWFKDKFNLIDRRDEITLGVSRYRQSDFTTLAEGQHRIACVSIYPIEKGFTEINSPILKVVDNTLIHFATLFGKNRILDVQRVDYNYWTDFKREMTYLMALDNSLPVGGAKKYKVMNHLSDLELDVNLLIIPTVEGGHFLCEGNVTTNPDNWNNLKTRILYVKNQDCPLFFVTLAHHFYNGLCTHAKSLFGSTGNLLDQKKGMRENGFVPADGLDPISDIGRNVIDLLLSTENGKRVLIDVKHMSKEARSEYYALLASDKYANEAIPIIYSHGALNIEDDFEINLDFDDVHHIYASKGIIGIEIDQRILGYNEKRFSKWATLKGKKKRAYLQAMYFWRQLISIAEYAYTNGFNENPWQCLALGSDYDGIIDPLNSYRDSGSMGILYENLVVYLQDYWDGTPVIPRNHGGDALDIIYQVMYKNAHSFIVEHYLEPLIKA